MPLSGTGTYTAPSSTWNPAVDSTVINSTDWNALLSDLSTALSTCLFKDGQATPTQDIPMGGFKLTGLAAGTAAADAVRLDQLRTTAVDWAAAAGTVDAITAGYTPAVSAVSDGLLLGFRATGANTSTAPTFAPDGLTARTITKKGGSALVAGDIPAALAECLVRFNLANTRWELLNVMIPLASSNLVGTTTNDNAAAGIVGEVISSAVLRASPTSISNGTAKTITSISLTAGDWDVFMSSGFIPDASTNPTLVAQSISETTNTLDATIGFVSLQRMAAFTPGLNADLTLASLAARKSLAATTTIFAVVQGAFAAGTMSAYVRIWARRAR